MVDVVTSIDRRMRRKSAVDMDAGKMERSLVRDILRVGFRFDCSMLQTQDFNRDGELQWRDVCCDDEDDFISLWSKCLDSVDFMVTDQVLCLPSERPKHWMGPQDMQVNWLLGDSQKQERRDVCYGSIERILHAGDEDKERT